MSDKPKSGRILRDLRQVEAEEERLARFDEWVEEMRHAGCVDPEDPVELANFQAELDRESDEIYRSFQAFEQMEQDERAELQQIRDRRPLGVPPPIEPRSIHSQLPQPAWKRKLRP
ncbi:hypothetical protein [Bradyrhizobium sp. AUGA SZCCT0182]|uniref:hypothetical protein n=1 Tax=Bradyrhizobium sp. AUGA SZCCT0182 TaxID=2807667 RepID=UPI001BAE3BA4|nr:hypothetical protein [Bradyrhizobium sp. AUGA SZCCT0182]MBR1235738.1 hypothetical protein [Bradyrhizobium sp. AUGA SZCCT0182]